MKILTNTIGEIKKTIKILGIFLCLTFTYYNVNAQTLNVGFVGGATKIIKEGGTPNTPLSLSIGGATISSDIDITVTLTKSNTSSITLSGSGVTNSDFVTNAPSGTTFTHTIVAGDYSTPISIFVNVQITDDNIVEANESFIATITTTSSDVSLTQDSQTVTIEDDDKLSISFVGGPAKTIEEGDSPNAPITIIVSGGTTTSSLVVSMGLTTATPKISSSVNMPGLVDSDFVVNNPALSVIRITIPPNDYSNSANQNIVISTVQIKDDGIAEVNEQFTATLTTTLVQIELLQMTQTVTILDNDKLEVGFVNTTPMFTEEVANSLTLKVSGVVLSAQKEITITLSDNGSTISLPGQTNSDFVARTSGVPNVLEYSVTIPAEDYTVVANQNLVVNAIQLNNDSVFEVNESFKATLSIPPASIGLLSLEAGKNEAVVTIQDSDITVSFVGGASKSIEEGATIPISITVTGGTTTSNVDLEITLSKSTSDTVFLPGETQSDFVAGKPTSVTTTFRIVPADYSTALIYDVTDIMILDDAMVEPDEIFIATLSVKSGQANFTNNRQEIKIIDNDISVRFAGNNEKTIAENASINTPLALTVTGASITNSVVVNMTISSTTGNTVSLPGTANSDFVANNPSATTFTFTLPAKDYTIVANQTVIIDNLKILNDSFVEGNEKFTARLLTGLYTLGSVTEQTVTILNDDKIEVGFNQVQDEVNVSEGDISKLSDIYALYQCTGGGYNTCYGGADTSGIIVDIKVTSTSAVFKLPLDGNDGDYLIKASAYDQSSVDLTRKSVIIKVPLSSSSSTSLLTTPYSIDSDYFQIIDDKVIDIVDGDLIEKITFEIIENEWVKPVATSTKEITAGNTINTKNTYSMNVSDNDTLTVEFLVSNTIAAKNQPNDQPVLKISGGIIKENLDVNVVFNVPSDYIETIFQSTVINNGSFGDKIYTFTIPKKDYTSETIMKLNEIMTLKSVFIYDSNNIANTTTNIRLQVINSSGKFIYNPSSSTVSSSFSFGSISSMIVQAVDDSKMIISWQESSFQYYEKNATNSINVSKTSRFPVLEIINSPNDKVDVTIHYTIKNKSTSGRGQVIPEELVTDTVILRTYDVGTNVANARVMYDFNKVGNESDILKDDEVAQNDYNKVYEIDVSKVTFTTPTGSAVTQDVFYLNTMATAYINNDDFVRVDFYEVTKTTQEDIANDNLPKIRIAGAILSDQLAFPLEFDGVTYDLLIPKEDYRVAVGAFKILSMFSGTEVSDSRGVKVSEFIVTDSIIEPSEVIKLRFGTPPSYVNKGFTDLQLESTLTVNNDDTLDISFKETAYSSNEGDSSSKITLQASGAITTQPAFVFLKFDRGAGANYATNPADYIKNKVLVEIPADDYTASGGKDIIILLRKSGELQIVDDNIMENDEVIELSLEKNVMQSDMLPGVTLDSNLQNNIRFLASTPNYTIVNDDKLTIGFQGAQTTIGEDGVVATDNSKVVVSGAVTVAALEFYLELKYPVPPAGGSTNWKQASVADVTFKAPTESLTVGGNNITVKKITIPADDYTMSPDSSGPPKTLEIISNLNVIEDTRIEGEERFELVLHVATSNDKKIEIDANASKHEQILSDNDVLSAGFELQMYEGNEDTPSTVTSNLYPVLIVSGADLTAATYIEVTILGGDGIVAPGKENNDYELSGSMSSSNRINILPKNYTDPANQKIYLHDYFTVVTDKFLEFDESIKFTLTNPGSTVQIGGNREATYSIKNDDNLIVGFNSATYEGVEGTSNTLPSLTISGAKTFAPVMMVVSIEPKNPAITGITDSLDNASSPNQDYVTDYGSDIKNVNKYVEIPKLDAIAESTINLNSIVSIVNDKYLESDEVLKFNVSNPTSILDVNYSAVKSVSGTTVFNETEYKIVNNDYLYVDLTKANYQGDETNDSEFGNEDLPQLSVRGADAKGLDTNVLTLKLEFSQPNSLDYKIDNQNINETSSLISRTYDFVIPSEDYTTKKTLNIPFNPIGDKDIEDNEDVTIKLLRVSSTVVGQPNTHEYINYSTTAKKVATQTDNPDNLIINSNYKIINDDRLTIQFSQSSYKFNEGDPSDATANLSKPSVVVVGANLTKDIVVPILVIPNSVDVTKYGSDGDYVFTGTNYNDTTKKLNFTIVADNYFNNPKTLLLSDFEIKKDKYLEIDKKVNFTILTNEIVNNNFVNINEDGTFARPRKSADNLNVSADLTIKNDDVLIVSFDKTLYEADEDTNGNHPQLRVSGALTKVAYTVKVKLSELENSLGQSGVTGLVKHEIVKERLSNEDYIVGKINDDIKEITVRIPIISNLTQPVIVDIGSFEVTADDYVEATEKIKFTLDVSNSNKFINYDTVNERRLDTGASNVNWNTTYNILNDDNLIISFTKDKYERFENEPSNNLNTPSLSISGVIISEDYTVNISILPKANNNSKKIPSAPGGTIPDYTVDGISDQIKNKVTITIAKDDYTSGKVIEIPAQKFSPIEDKYLEDDETVTLTLEKDTNNAKNYGVLLGKPGVNPSSPRVLASEFVIKNDDKIIVKFSESEYKNVNEGNEENKTATFIVEATGGDLLEEVKLDIEITPGSSEVILDNDYSLGDTKPFIGGYIPRGGSVPVITVPVGMYSVNKHSETYKIEYIKDNRLENDETIILNMIVNPSTSDETKQNVQVGERIESGGVKLASLHKSKMIITNDDFITISFKKDGEDKSSELIQRENIPITDIPDVKIEGADLTGYTETISFTVNMIADKSSIENGVDFTELPKMVVLSKNHYKNLTLPANQTFDLNDLLNESNRLRIINDEESEINEKITLILENPMNILVKDGVYQDNDKEKKYNEKTITITDDEPNIKNSLFSSNKVTANADGQDSIILSIKLKNGQDEFLVVDQSPPVKIFVDESVPTPLDDVTANEAENRYELTYKRTKPGTVRFIARTNNNQELEKKVSVEFLGPNTGRYINDDTNNGDTTPELKGTAPYGTLTGVGNTVTVSISNSTGIIWTGTKIKIDKNTNSWVVPGNTLAEDLPNKELQDGRYTVTVTVIDPAGNESSKVRHLNELRVESVLPEKCTVIPIVTYNRRPPISGTATTKTSVELTIDGITYDKVEVDDDGNWTLPADTISPLDRNKKYNVSIYLYTNTGKRSELFPFSQVIHISDFPITTNEGFSPNGDGINDKWHIADIEDYPNNKVTIFNRWGNIVWEKTNYNNNNNAWAGESQQNILSRGEKLPGSVYFYVIDLNNGNEPVTGFITVAN